MSYSPFFTGIAEEYVEQLPDGGPTRIMPVSRKGRKDHFPDAGQLLRRGRRARIDKRKIKMIRRAVQTCGSSKEEGKKNAYRRNGVERIMSVMRRKYGIDHI